jgi:integrase/recombinase XerD
VDVQVPAPAGDDVREWVAAWLLGFASANTRRAYAGDLASWLSFCDDHGLDPFTVRRPHVDAWARSLELANQSARAVARRLAAVSS